MQVFSDGDFLPLCTVTFWQKVYFFYLVTPVSTRESRLYGILRQCGHLYFFDIIWQILTKVQCRARTYAQLLLVFVIMMTSVDASQPTEVHIHRKRILPVFSGKKSRKNYFLPTFVLLLTKIDYFLWNVLQWYLVWNSKKVREKNKEIFVTFHLWFEIWSR